MKVDLKKWGGYFYLQNISLKKIEKFNEISKFLAEKKYVHIDNLTSWDYLFKFNKT